jgi:Photosynthetic reaction centre cytochrome C subunit
MVHHQKKLTLMAIISLAVIATAATISTGKKYKNLKVLPQDISEKKLDSIMDTYTKALKVSCDFCHVPPKKDMFSITPANNESDFALDNEMKENARRMMRMTIEINKKYFYFDSIVQPEYLNVVHCNTCHRGNPYPVNE